jgi:hypothetical protein
MGLLGEAALSDEEIELREPSTLCCWSGSEARDRGLLFCLSLCGLLCFVTEGDDMIVILWIIALSLFVVEYHH